MKKLFVSLLAAMMLCTGMSQLAFAAEVDETDTQTPIEHTDNCDEDCPIFYCINNPDREGD